MLSSMQSSELEHSAFELMVNFEESCVGIQCRNIAETLQKLMKKCRNPAETMQKPCRNLAETLQKLNLWCHVLSCIQMSSNDFNLHKESNTKFIMIYTML
jgi:hypothetical protein